MATKSSNVASDEIRNANLQSPKKLVHVSLMKTK
jgi:hypothetical protein